MLNHSLETEFIRRKTLADSFGKDFAFAEFLSEFPEASSPEFIQWALGRYPDLVCAYCAGLGSGFPDCPCVCGK